MQIFFILLFLALTSLESLAAVSKISLHQQARIQRSYQKELNAAQQALRNARKNVLQEKASTPTDALKKLVLPEPESQSEQKIIEMPLPVASDEDNTISFGFSALLQNRSKPELFLLGADKLTGEGLKEFVLTRGMVDTTTSPATLNLLGIANPDLPGKPLSALTIAQPATETPVPVFGVADSGTLYTIPHLYMAVPAIEENPGVLKDAAGTVLTNQGPQALAAGIVSSRRQSFVFAAVPGKDTAFENPTGPVLPGSENRGIIPVILEPSTLTLQQDPQNPQAIKLKATAVPDSNQAELHTAFFGTPLTGGSPGPITNALFNHEVALYWHEKLHRLYIGLSGVRRNNDALEGGVMALLSGRFDGATFKLEPVIHQLAKKHLYQEGSDVTQKNVIDTIVGFYSNGQDTRSTSLDTIYLKNGTLPMELSIKRITSMSTSTGKEYLIVQGAGPDQLETEGDTNNLFGIFALPLLSEKLANGSAVPVNQIGTLADKHFTGPVSGLNQLPRATAISNRVGGLIDDYHDTLLAVFPDAVSDLFVDGDTVYICMKGNDSRHIGFYASTALFDAEGIIVGWTPWSAVAGQTGRVFTGKRSHTTGNYFFATEEKAFNPQAPEEATDGNVAALSCWNKGDDQNNNLPALLAALFTQQEGGVYQLFDCNQFAPAFDLGKFSMLIALGNEKMALIKTGAYDNASNSFYPVPKHALTGPDQTIFLLEDPVLKEIGPLCCAALSSGARSNKGYLFVGGYRGVAVLTDHMGRGFQTPLTNLSSAAGSFPTGYTFKKLSFANQPPLTSCTKIVPTADGMTLALGEKLYTIDLATPPDLTHPLPTTVTTPCPGAIISDYRFIWKKGIATTTNFTMFAVATSKGLFVSHNNGASWQEIALGDEKGLPTLQLFYLSDRLAIDGALGNLFVLQADRARVPSRGFLYRFAVNTEKPESERIKQISSENLNGLFLSFREYRGGFFYDGTIALASRGLHFSDTQLLNNVPIMSSNEIISLTPQLAIIPEINYTIGVPLIESTSGALIVPGDWGIRLNN